MLFSAKHPYTQTKTLSFAKKRYFLSAVSLDEILFYKISLGFLISLCNEKCIQI